MLTTYVARGLKAGLVAGLAFGLLVALLGNPLVGAAEHAGHADGAHHESVVPEAITEAVSVAAGVLWGLLLGAGFGVAYYVLEPALPGAAGVRSLVLAAAGFVTVSGAPWLVLPPQPAGVEQALPTDLRLAWYGGMMVAGAAACVAAGDAARQVAAGRGARAAGSAALALAVLAVPVALAPTNALTELPSADLTAAFRVVVVAGQVGIWVALAAAHTWLLRRSGRGVLARPGADLG